MYFLLPDADPGTIFKSSAMNFIIAESSYDLLRKI